MNLGTVLSIGIAMGGLAAILLVVAAVLLFSGRGQLTRERLGILIICLVLLLILIAVSLIAK